jgi:aldose 1-epimerase
MADIETLGQIAGADVSKATLRGANGLCLRLISYGARLAELWVPDRSGAVADIVLGHDTLDDWQTQPGYLGATCGRYANRIATGQFMLNGQSVQINQNEGAQTLHGGVAGFDRKVWQIDSHSDAHVTYATTSAAGEMGFPGALRVWATYRITATGLLVQMRAVTDAPTVINLVNHAYFNLAGQGSGAVLDQRLCVQAGHYLPVDDRLIPTGEVLSVAGTAFDFRALRPIGAPFPGPSGFDHNLCLSAPADVSGLRPCLLAVDPATGRQLRLATTEPGVQLYTGAHFDGTPGKAGARYGRFAGFAIETQCFPDSPNRPHFPPARLDPGQTYDHWMQFDFTPAAV